MNEQPTNLPGDAACIKCGREGHTLHYVREKGTQNYLGMRPWFTICLPPCPEGEHLHVKCSTCHARHWKRILRFTVKDYESPIQYSCTGDERSWNMPDREVAKKRGWWTWLTRR